MRTILKKMTFVGIALFGFAGMVVAQPMSPQMEGYINEEVLPRRNGGAAPQNTGPSAAEVRAWHARERKVQAEIAQLRATPFYMAIANDFTRDRIMYAGGFGAEQRAIEETLKYCKSSNCQVLKTISNTCAVMTFPANRRPQSPEDFFFGVHKDHNQAAALSIQACEANFGKGNCLYFAGKTKHGTAFCTGYDYSIYGQK